ncbi:hypothetical protein Ndes2526B_g00093 [Nannochloris sp. 'desiccata']
MSSSTALQQQLSKLDTPGPVQHYAIVAIFDAVCRGTSLPSSSAHLSTAASEAAILQCLCLQDGQAAGVAAEKLLEATRGNKVDTNAAQSLLLTALTVASPASAAPLTAALVSIWHFQLSRDLTNVGNPTQNMLWKSHILSKALIASPFAGIELISSICKMLSKQILASASTEDYNVVLNSLRPFLSFVFLDPTVLKQYPQHATNLHSSLVRTAAAVSRSPAPVAPESQHAMLRLLCSFLPTLQVQSTAQQLFAESCIADIMDLLESCELEPGVHIVTELVEALFSLCDDISSYGGSIAPCIAALGTIFSYWKPAVVLDTSGSAGAIPLQLTKFSVRSSVSSGDATAALSLLCSVLLFEEEKEEEEKEEEEKAGGGVSGQRHQQQPQWLAAAMSVQLAPGMAFGQLKNVKEWTSRALAAVNKYNSTYISSNGDMDRSSVLSMLWSNSSVARCWLHSLESDLSSIETPSTNTLASISLPTTAILLTLMHHPEAVVARSAVEALIAAVRAAPLLGITALPVVIHKLHATVERITTLFGKTDNDKDTQSDLEAALASVLPTLYALPRLAVHPSTVAFTVRALQPLLAPPAPEFLQGVALRMLCEMWLTTGRGFPHLRTALLSYSAPAGGRRTAITPQMAEDPALRRAWAASLADVCAQDGERAKDLIHAITECLENSAQDKGRSIDPEVQAAGLECVAELCEADILDFYKAWKIVQPLVPTLPQHPLAAGAWLRVLASGGLDSAVYPEISRGILKALWAAASNHHSVASSVRSQACASLANYDFVVLEENGILTREMWEFAALLRNQQRGDNNDVTDFNISACEELVVHVLRYEHTIRRRQQRGNVGKISKSSTTPGGTSSRGRFPWSNRTRAALAGAGDAQGVMHKLVSILPKALLGRGSRDPKDFLRRLPDVTPLAVLLLWSPPPPPPVPSQQAAAAKKSAAAVAAKQAVAAYSSIFSELCKQTEAGFALSGMYTSKNNEILAAWASFIKRWASAAKDVAGGAAAAIMAPNERTVAGAQAVWQVIKTSLESGHTNASNMNVALVSSAACAAAALASSVHPQPIKPIVKEVFTALAQHAQQELDGSTCNQAAACTSLGYCADVARSILGLPAASAALDILQRHLENPDAPPAVRVGSAIGLSLAVKQLATKVYASVQNVTVVVKSLILSLLKAAGCHFSENIKHEILIAVEDFDAGENFSISSTQQNLPEEVFDAVLVGLAESLSAMLAAGLPTSLLSTLRKAATAGLLSGSGTAVHGMCELLRASTLTGFKMNVINLNEVVETLHFLREMTLTGSASSGAGRIQNGKLAGAAALSLGNIIPSLIKEGCVFPSPSDASSTQYLDALLVLASDTGESKIMSSRAAAKQGAAGGIAALLCGKLHQFEGEDVVLFTDTEKQALEVLEFLSLKDDDFRSRRGCGRALAGLCWSARHDGKLLLDLPDDASLPTTTGISTDTPSISHVTKGVASLPENSALRYLCETLDCGAWPEIFEDEEKDDDAVNENIQERKEEKSLIVEHSTLLTSDQAAAVLRCLAAAPRLPVMDWSAACRRLLRTHQGSAAVQKAVVVLFSTHASVSQALHMYEFIIEDIFGQPGFTAWQSEAQHAVLEELERLLAAVPDAEATSMIRMLCSEKICPDAFQGTDSGDNTNRQLIEWQAALLQGLAATAASTQVKDGLGQTAWECAVHVVLPKLPTPTTWPLSLRLSSLHHYIQKEGSSCGKPSSIASLNLLKPWKFVLECALTAPSAALDTLCSQEINATTFAKNPVHWTWLCAALVANTGVDLRGLQQPRNYIIQGGSGSGSGDNYSNKYDDDVVLLLVVRALMACNATIAQKQQWIVDVLHAAEKCTAPAAAVKLAACATVALASGGGKQQQEELCFGKSHSVLVDCETALRELPDSVKHLAESIEPCPVALLTSIVVVVGNNEEIKGNRELQKRCCWALRHVLPSETWVELYRRVEGEK